MFKTSGIKISTYIYSTEIGLKWDRLGDANEYFWQTLEEKQINRFFAPKMN